MRTYPMDVRIRRRSPFAILLGLTLLLGASRADAQRKYLFELGGAGSYTQFDRATELDPAPGGLVRAGLWLPAHFSLEAEGTTARPKTTLGGVPVRVRSVAGSLLFNIPIGRANSTYLRGGYGSTDYGTCPLVSVPGSGPCGTTGVVIGGLGFRVGITETVMIRAEGTINRSTALDFSNYGGSLGLSVMLGSKRIIDGDKDGVLDSDDRCPRTPIGAIIDGRGCPSDTDADGVYDGLDRCPTTAAGAKVDGVGCPVDSDHDTVPDGIDRCANTPAGAVVDSTGCPKDADGDGTPDGLDRCADTPPGAIVDQLGCPGDSDSDGVLDGLDRCPNTPTGTRVNAFGCRPGEVGGAPAEAKDTVAEPPPAPEKPFQMTYILEGVTFASGSAWIAPKSKTALDSLAAELKAHPDVRVEIGGHTDNSGDPIKNQHLSTLRAEAVRQYLIDRGVPIGAVTAKGYGSSQPLQPGNSAAARAANRRVEVRPLPTGP